MHEVSYASDEKTWLEYHVSGSYQASGWIRLLILVYFLVSVAKWMRQSFKILVFYGSYNILNSLLW